MEVNLRRYEKGWLTKQFILEADIQLDKDEIQTIKRGGLKGHNILLVEEGDDPSSKFQVWELSSVMKGRTQIARFKNAALRAQYELRLKESLNVLAQFIKEHINGTEPEQHLRF